MILDHINNILNGALTDEKTGKKIFIPINKIEIKSRLIDNIAKIAAELLLPKKIAVVSDIITHKIAGFKLEANLAKAEYEISSIVLPRDIEADENNIKYLSDLTANVEYIIAVGSGTINDLCKLASYQQSKPYLVFGTATSMNGYASSTSSIKTGAHKTSIKAHLPKAILLDLDILYSQPQRLLISGIGDSLARNTAQADWLLSHLLLGTEYNKDAFEILKPFESDMYLNIDRIIARDYEYLELLAGVLILSGIGMYLCEGSYPASQSEHLLAHYMEIMHEKEHPFTYHGEQISVTTLAISRLQDAILVMEKPALKFKEIDENLIKTHFGEYLYEECLLEFKQKFLSRDKIDEINQNLNNNWHKIRAEIKQNHVSPDRILTAIKTANLPDNCLQIGWNSTSFKNGIKHAMYLRNRFTFLDFASLIA
jgi:glycerol-1-phosphate dehydrogenase [NAD(P)+]